MSMGLPAEAATLRKHSTWFLIYGIVLIVLGGIAILAPGLATLWVEFTVAWLLLIAGVFGLVTVYWAGRTAPGFWWNLLTAVVCVLAGLSLLTRPASGAITLTILLAAYFLASGVVHIALAFGYKTELPGAWLWMLVSGVVDIILGMIIISGMPGTAGWVIGLLVGINLLMLGIAIVMAALAIRKTAGG